MPTFSQSSLDKLAACDNRLQKILQEAIKYIDFTVLQGHRGEVEQNAAVAAGTSKLPWPQGNHNAMPSRAVDVAPWFQGPVSIDWKDLPAFARLMGYIQRISDEQGVKLRFGLDWNGNFRTLGDESFIDAPHVELAKDEL